MYFAYMYMYMEQKRFQGKKEDSGILETLPKDLHMSPYCYIQLNKTHKSLQTYGQ